MTVSSELLAAQQLESLSPDIRLVIFNPDFRQQHTLLNRVLNAPRALYVRLDGGELTAAHVEEQIARALEQQGSPVTLADLDALVLDECDRVLQPEAAHLLPSLVLEKMRGRVYLLTRQLPHVTLSNETLRAHTRVLPSEDQLMLVGYAQRANGSEMLLEVRALGPGRVQLNGRPVDNWDGVLPRSLFLYLVDRGMTTRQEIFDTFWPTLSTREATNVFHVTKRKINEVLGVDLTTYWSGFYHIAPDIQLNYDAALFTGMVQDSAVVGDDEAVALLRRATALYRTDFLVGIDMPWARRRREELRQTYGEALVALAKALERRGEIRQALGLYLRAATTNRQREDLAMVAMRLYRELGMPRDALFTYDRLEQELRRTLGVSPAPHVQALAKSIHDELAQAGSAS